MVRMCPCECATETIKKYLVTSLVLKLFKIVVLISQTPIGQKKESIFFVWISAPEMMSGRGYGQWCDVWSIGIIMYML